MFLILGILWMFSMTHYILHRWSNQEAKRFIKFVKKNTRISLCSNHPNCLEINAELEIFFRYECCWDFVISRDLFTNILRILATAIGLNLYLFRFIDSLNLLRGFFIFVIFVCKSSVIRKIRRALWPTQQHIVAWDGSSLKVRVLTHFFLNHKKEDK